MAEGWSEPSRVWQQSIISPCQSVDAGPRTSLDPCYRPAVARGARTSCLSGGSTVRHIGSHGEQSGDGQSERGVRCEKWVWRWWWRRLCALGEIFCVVALMTPSQT